MLRTWDIFDTLIARRCVFPQRVFDIVEQRLGVKNFANMRKTAEQLILNIGINFKLGDIYDVMWQIFKLDKQTTDRWKQVELDVEFEQAIPIAENINQVCSGDVLISDMYLPTDSVRRMLEKCGLFVPVEVIISNNVKSNGKIWKQFREQGLFVMHTGDNEISDVAKPREFGMESSWTVLHRPTPLETQLLKIDFEFGAYLRELRLANPFDEEVKRNYWSLFVINVGILILIAQLIDRVQKTYGFEYLGFCGRDTYYMRQIYRRLKSDRNEPIPANDYLYYSRKLVKNSEEDLIKYFANEIDGRRALMIDLFGTGTNLSMLRSRAKLNYSILLCILLEHKLAAEIYSEIRQFLPADWIGVKDALSDTHTQGAFEKVDLCLFDRVKDALPVIDNVELFNRATHNSPIKLKAGEFDKTIIPAITFTAINDTENLDVFETCMKRVLQSKIQWTKLERTEDLLSLSKLLILSFDIQAKQSIFRSQHNLQEVIEAKLRSAKKQ